MVMVMVRATVIGYVKNGPRASYGESGGGMG